MSLRPLTFVSALLAVCLFPLLAFTQISTDWDCDAGLYGDGWCDCGCGAVDTDDCIDKTANWCDWDHDHCPGSLYPEWRNNSNCIELDANPEFPDGWRCSSIAWADGYCDCGCGGMDTDCPSLDAVDCDEDWCSWSEWPGYFDNTTCVAFGMDTDLPAEWGCSSLDYGNGPCDCGCYAADLDCGDNSIHSCNVNNCFDETDTVASYPGFNENMYCYPLGDDTDPALIGWTCLPRYLGDGGCDCGCGTVDIDCLTDAADDCYETHCEAGQTVADGNLGTCITTEVDTHGGIDTETLQPTDSNTALDTIGDTTDSVTDVMIDTDSQSADSGSDTSVDTGAVDSGVDSGNTDTSDSGIDSTTASGTEPAPDSADTTPTADTLTTDSDNLNPQSDSGAPGIDTTSPQDSQPIAPKPKDFSPPVTPAATTETKKDSGGSLFGCTLNTGSATASLFHLVF